MNEFVVATMRIGDWTIMIEEVQSEQNQEIIARDYTAYKMDSSGKPIIECFEDLLATIEFAQLDSGILVYGYPELETMARKALMFWETYTGRGAK